MTIWDLRFGFAPLWPNKVSSNSLCFALAEAYGASVTCLWFVRRLWLTETWGGVKTNQQTVTGSLPSIRCLFPITNFSPLSHILALMVLATFTVSKRALYSYNICPNVLIALNKFTTLPFLQTWLSKIYNSSLSTLSYAFYRSFITKNDYLLLNGMILISIPTSFIR